MSGLTKPFSRWSFSRPGVATRIDGGAVENIRLSTLMLVPPTIDFAVSPSPEDKKQHSPSQERRELATTSDCKHQSAPNKS